MEVLQLIYTDPDTNEVTIDIDEQPREDARWNSVRARMLTLEAMQRGPGWSFRTSVPTETTEEPQEP